MYIKELKDSKEIARAISDLIVERIKEKPNLLICAATGGTPTQTYQQLVDQKSRYSTEKLRVIKLDEWGGVPMDNPETCESYMQKHILKPLNIHQENYFGFNSNAPNPEEEIQRIKSELKKNGPIDICILGLGMNGHIAFNEPPSDFNSECHIATLSKESLLHPMAVGMGTNPTCGLTLGIQEIMQSKTIFLIITGEHKQEIAKNFLTGSVSKHLPASYLWMHSDVHCYIDKQANNKK